MTPLVVDASVAMAWLIPLPHSAAADALPGGAWTLLAPDFMRVEVASGLWKQVRWAGLPKHVASGCLVVLDKVAVAYEPSRPLVAAALDIACDVGCSTYDALYVALASSHRCALVTADRKLVSKLAGSAYAGLVRAL
jgi:predicted nucleic acid-binding protein